MYMCVYVCDYICDCVTLTIVQWFTWGVSVGYEWLPTVVPLRNTVVPLKNIVDITWVSQEQ